MNTLIKKLFKPRNDNQSLKEAIEEIIEDHGENNNDNANGLKIDNSHEKTLIANILKLQEKTAEDVMVPRADIIALEAKATQEELMSLLAEHQYSRFPVYKEHLDDIIGTIHIKDMIASLAKGKPIAIADLVRPIPIVSPAMPVSDLILFMKEKRKHMVLIVDEYGGIDGLITLGDIIESIIGEIEDEYDTSNHTILVERQDGTILGEGRVELEEFEEKFGKFFTEDDHEEADTLGGLVFSIAGYVPARGEIITHENGMEFEILDAGPRRINRLKIRNLDKAREAANSQNT
jgi:CBS domain containing-hemolysin-like protein